ncbi:MAG TPA: 2OG-Fe(II) oxygenase [Bryobacteraceae bacterium]|nr:2OG-Fe(II) oxygenase [Bryobacteraceae bacterium]
MAGATHLTFSRTEIAGQIVNRLSEQREEAAAAFNRRPAQIPSFVCDNLLPPAYAQAIYKAFPSTERLVLKKTLGQLKYVGYQMSAYDPLLEEAVYAFQDPRVVNLIASITRITGLLPDERLYAGGVSLMAQGHYLNPHLDNSHDRDRQNYRALNLLYYVTPDWRDDYGGHLELWDNGPGQPQRTLHSRFNRLVVMRTDERSWHSVSPVIHAAYRCCVSNYYFSPQPVGRDASYHVTSFRGWPGQKIPDLFMRLDSGVRWAVRKIGGNWLFKNPHVYKK